MEFLEGKVKTNQTRGKMRHNKWKTERFGGLAGYLITIRFETKNSKFHRIFAPSILAS